MKGKRSINKVKRDIRLLAFHVLGRQVHTLRKKKEKGKRRYKIQNDKNIMSKINNTKNASLIKYM